MKIFNKPKTTVKENTRVASRAVRMSTPDIILWMDSLIMQLGKGFDSYKYDKKIPKEDVDMLIEAIAALWKELGSRE